jgi:hypothetical protein
MCTIEGMSVSFGLHSRVLTACAGPIVVMILSTDASAQTVSNTAPVQRGTDLAVFAGVSSNADATAAGFAGIAGWQYTPTLAFEARFGWYDREAGSQGFGADFGVMYRVPRATFRPFVAAGMGLYRASFDPGVVPASDFYRLRTDPETGPSGGDAFTDTAARFGGGLDMSLGRNITLRPEASALVVWDGGRTYTMALVGVRLGYHFEDEPVTPARRSARSAR